MVFMKWTPAYSVKVKEFDEQHKKLFAMINLIAEDIVSGDNKKRDEVVNQMIEFSRIHFSTEEKYFKKFKYPKEDEHIKLHIDFIETSLEFSRRTKKNEIDSNKILNYLKNWWNNHVLIEDKKYSKFLNDHGLR